VSVAVKKLEGVDSVDVSLEKATADVRLKPGNTVTLGQLRKVIRDGGYPTKDAQLEARGQIVERNGTLIFDLMNGTSLEISGSVDKRPAGAVDIVGVARTEAKNRETLTITTIR
jgi:copper chaperone CopZ